MKKYYLYGAGINCSAVIKFYGQKRILGIIDSDEKKQGLEIEGIKVIPLQQYLKEGNNEQIIITAYFASESIEQILQREGITNYYVSAYMQTGFFVDAIDIIEKINLTTYSRVCFITQNPISEWIYEEFSKMGKKMEFVYLDKQEIILKENDIVLVTNNNEKEKSKLYTPEIVKDINKIYEEKYAFRNPELRRFKDIHDGKRCFIIGNGPSLRYEDLEELYKNNEICFAANRIYNVYDNTNWRPNYYVLIDHTVYEQEKINLSKIKTTKFIRQFYKDELEDSIDDLYKIGGICHQPNNPGFSWDIEKGVYIGYSVIYDALQIAVYMGFKEIYFLGVDMTFNKKSVDEVEHFFKTKHKKEDSKLIIINLNEVISSLEYARDKLLEQGIIVKNATRGGELEVFERVDFDDLMKETEK